VPLCGAVATGEKRQSDWLDLIEAAANLTPAPLVLAATQQAMTLAQLHALSRIPRVILLVTGAADLALAPGRGPALPLVPTARALGLCAAALPEEALESAHLLRLGVRPGRPSVKIAATDAGGKVMLLSALRQAGLGAGWTGDAAAPDGEPRRELSYIGSAGLRKMDEVNAVSLQALAGIGQVRPRDAATGAPTRADLSQAHRLLDRWPVALDEYQVKRLVSLFGITTPLEELVTSASAAAAAADRIGLPVAVKAVGPALRDRRRAEAAVLGLESFAAVRQAFRDVLQACSRMTPSPALSGVLVCAMARLPSQFEAAILCEGESAPLMLMRVTGSTRGEIVRACPFDRRQAELAAAALAEDGLITTRGRLSAAQIRRTADLLRRLSWLALRTRERLRWLRLDAITPPEGRRPPLVLDGHGEQTESYRDPLGTLG
jgi:hypothetical protein